MRLHLIMISRVQIANKEIEIQKRTKLTNRKDAKIQENIDNEKSNITRLYKKKISS